MCPIKKENQWQTINVDKGITELQHELYEQREENRSLERRIIVLQAKECEVEELKRLAEARDKAAKVLLDELRADAEIAENMRSYWK